VPPPLPGARYLSIAGANRDVAEVLEIMSAERLNWTALYKIYEIIQDTGMLETVTQTASISNRDITRFIRTANIKRLAVQRPATRASVKSRQATR
jgi:precorrin isomerase